LQIKNQKDFIAGLMFAAIGIGALVLGGDYRRGTAANMGPGYFPMLLGILLCVLGVALALRALRKDGARFPHWPLRPTLIVLGSVVLFGVIVTQAGLIVSTIVLILLSSAASREFRLREAMVASVILAVMVVLVFVYGLKLILPIWPVLS
jgi:hypothetical protein